MIIYALFVYDGEQGLGKKYYLVPTENSIRMFYLNQNEQLDEVTPPLRWNLTRERGGMVHLYLMHEEQTQEIKEGLLAKLQQSVIKDNS